MEVFLQNFSPVRVKIHSLQSQISFLWYCQVVSLTLLAASTFPNNSSSQKLSHRSKNASYVPENVLWKPSFVISVMSILRSEIPVYDDSNFLKSLISSFIGNIRPNFTYKMKAGVTHFSCLLHVIYTKFTKKWSRYIFFFAFCM